MEKLEQYLDQVCRRIGGPRALRQHIRQELAEHLRDAAAEHRAAGLSEEAALARALDDFGKPEEVRSGLEEAHGQRLMAVVIDKAIQWKEMTMKARWVWTSWAHLALVSVIALELLWIVFTTVFIVPKFQRLMQDGIIDPAVLDDAALAWMSSFLSGLGEAGRYAALMILMTAVVWGLFEWRVRSENKTFMRLSGLGTVAVGLMVVAVLMAGGLVVTFCMGVPAVGRMVRPFALDQVARIDASVSALEQALKELPNQPAHNDWQALEERADRLTAEIDTLVKAPPAIPALTSWSKPPTADVLRSNLNTAKKHILDASQAIRDKDRGRVETAILKFHTSFAPVVEAAKKTQR